MKTSYRRQPLKSRSPLWRKINGRNILTRKLGDGWITTFVVGCQSLHVVENSTKARAIWFGDCLTTALENLIKENQ